MTNKPNAGSDNDTDYSRSTEVIRILEEAATEKNHPELALMLAGCGAVASRYGIDVTLDALLGAYTSVVSSLLALMRDAGRELPTSPGDTLRRAANSLERDVSEGEISPERAATIAFIEHFATASASQPDQASQSVGHLAAALIPVVRREGYFAAMDRVLNLYCSLSMSAMMSGRLEECPVNRMAAALEHFRESVDARRAGGPLPPGNYDVTPGPLDGPVAGRA